MYGLRMTLNLAIISRRAHVRRETSYRNSSEITPMVSRVIRLSESPYPCSVSLSTKEAPLQPLRHSFLLFHGIN